MNKKPLIWMAALICACLAIGGGVILLGKKKLWIATILPLTGPNAASGIGMRNAIRLAVDEANGRGGVQGHRIGLIELDDASQVANAGKAARTLAADSRVLAALIGYDHDCWREATATLCAARIPNMMGGVTARQRGGAPNDYEFRLLPDSTQQMDQAFNYAWDVVGARKFIYVHDGSAQGLAAVYDFRHAVGEKIRDRVSGDDTAIRAGETDFSAIIARARNEKPDYILFGGQPREGGLLLKQLREAGITTPFEVQTHELSAEFIASAQEKAEGAVQMFPGLPLEDTPEGKAFLALYEKAGYREPPGPFGLYAYAETQALLGAFDKSFLTRPSVRGALTNEEFETLLGRLRFFFLGSSYQRAVLYQVQKGRWTPFYATDAKGKLQPYAH